MKNFKRKNGITLIALVITIIVMLILVAVTINIAVNGGLFDYAGKAAQDTETKKQEELNWTNINANMSTDQLIAKYTGENPDLAVLRKFYIEGDHTVIPNPFESIKPAGLMGDDVVIGYNNAIYKITYTYNESTDTTSATKVEEITGDDAFPYYVMAYGTELFVIIGEVGFYDYQNEIYKVTIGKTSTTAVALESDEVVVGCASDGIYTINGYIQFKLTSTQKWYEWAENSSVDLNLLSTITLKSLIQDVNEKSTNKIIGYDIIVPDPDGISSSLYPYALRHNGEACTTDQDIIPHSVYVFKNVANGG